MRPPYDAVFLARFKAAQQARRDQIEAGILQRLAALEEAGLDDAVTITHRTHADPRFLDLSIDHNDRAVGSIWGDPAVVNRAPYAMARVSSLRSWLSQWSSRSLADGPVCLARTSVPVLLLTHTADGSTYPSTRDAWLSASPGRIRSVNVDGGTHYLKDQPDLVEFSAVSVARWVTELGRP